MLIKNKNIYQKKVPGVTCFWMNKTINIYIQWQYFQCIGTLWKPFPLSCLNLNRYLNRPDNFVAGLRDDHENRLPVMILLYGYNIYKQRHISLEPHRYWRKIVCRTTNYRRKGQLVSNENLLNFDFFSFHLPIIPFYVMILEFCKVKVSLTQSS